MTLFFVFQSRPSEDDSTRPSEDSTRSSEDTKNRVIDLNPKFLGALDQKFQFQKKASFRQSQEKKDKELQETQDTQKSTLGIHSLNLLRLS